MVVCLGDHAVLKADHRADGNLALIERNSRLVKSLVHPAVMRLQKIVGLEFQREAPEVADDSNLLFVLATFRCILA